MREFPRGVLFSDLDGTFLDRQYQPALDGAALRALAPAWRVIWVSSRTAAELLWLQRRLGHREDAIGENGGVLVTSDAGTAAHFANAEAVEDAWVATLAAPIAQTRARVMDALGAVGATATDVSQFGPDQLAARSGYGLDDARRALDRRTSVLLTDLSATAADALTMLRAAGCTVVHGGRWTSVVDGADKGRTARRWQSLLSSPVVSVGVGNAANDDTLLSAVDHAFVIRDAHHGPDAALSAIDGARVLTAVGTAGWPELVRLLPSLLPET
jgi:predicted mannosyl-3-phosphoglycerate phosphatase (HAD superfamily)